MNCEMMIPKGDALFTPNKTDEQCGKPAVIIAVLAKKEFTAKQNALCGPCAAWVRHYMLPGQFKFKELPK